MFLQIATNYKINLASATAIQITNRFTYSETIELYYLSSPAYLDVQEDEMVGAWLEGNIQIEGDVMVCFDTDFPKYEALKKWIEMNTL